MGTIASVHHMAPSIYHQYEVIGRRTPTEADPAPKAYRIKLFTKNETQARSRFWYFIRRLVKMKKANAEILSIKEIYEKKPEKVSKYGIWLRYDSRSGTTNMYQEMAGRHRARFSSNHIIKVQEIEASKCTRQNIKQYLKANIAFPLPHRITRANKKGFNKGTKAQLPCTIRQ